LALEKALGQCGGSTSALREITAGLTHADDALRSRPSAAMPSPLGCLRRSPHPCGGGAVCPGGLGQRCGAAHGRAPPLHGVQRKRRAWPRGPARPRPGRAVMAY